MIRKRVVAGAFLTLIVLCIASVYLVEYIEYRMALRKEAKARELIEIGVDEMEAARNKLEDNGFVVTDGAIHKRVGNVFLVKLKDFDQLDNFAAQTGIDPTPFGYEPKHWLVIWNEAGSNKVGSVE